MISPSSLLPVLQQHFGTSIQLHVTDGQGHKTTIKDDYLYVSCVLFAAAKKLGILFTDNSLLHEICRGLIFRLDLPPFGSNSFYDNAFPY